MPTLGEVLEGKEICICAGALKELGNEARRVGPSLFEEQGVEMKGELWAMMLDAKATFDELIARQAPDEESRDRVLENRIYQQISNALAGSQEYMAMEKLFELHTEGQFDLLVLDTPPTRNALDFLDAPRRLTQFIEGRSLRVFMRPTGLAAKVAGRGASVALSVFKRIVGFDLLADLAEFFNAFSGMVDGFQARAKRVNKLLADPRTCFLVVCGPQGEPVDEAVPIQSTCRRRWPRGSATRTWRGGWRPTSPTTRRWPSATPATSSASRPSCAPAASFASPTSTRTCTTWPDWRRSTATCSPPARSGWRWPPAGPK